MKPDETQGFPYGLRAACAAEPKCRGGERRLHFAARRGHGTDMERRPEMRTEDDLAAADPRPLPHPLRRTEAAPAVADAPRPNPAAPDLPGCRPIRLKRRDLDTWDGRFEYWDGDTETAWVMRDPTGIPHEHPSAAPHGVLHPHRRRARRTHRILRLHGPGIARRARRAPPDPPG